MSRDRTMSRLDQKVALVTGAARGIGRAVAERFAREGARVMVLDVNAGGVASTCNAITKAGGEALAAVCDVRHRRIVDAAVQGAMQRWGRVDVLINNAAVFPARVPFLDQTCEQWNDVLQVNVMGAFHATQAVARCMAKSSLGGRIVNVSSLNATHYRAGATGITQYGASKAALENMTKGWALELGAYGIVVNGVAFGFVRTDMAAGDGLDSEEFKQTYLERGRIPLRRVGTTSDCASLILFLASDECTGLTGEIIRQDGGLSFTF